MSVVIRQVPAIATAGMRLLRFARNDKNGCHCEERSDEAISISRPAVRRGPPPPPPPPPPPRRGGGGGGRVAPGGAVALSGARAPARRRARVATAHRLRAVVPR